VLLGILSRLLNAGAVRFLVAPKFRPRKATREAAHWRGKFPLRGPKKTGFHVIGRRIIAPISHPGRKNRQTHNPVTSNAPELVKSLEFAGDVSAQVVLWARAEGPSQ
jgi:hypothetical protein